MLYNRYSVAVAKLWFQHGLLAGKPWRTLDNIAWNHIESIGTKVYTVKDIEALFGDFLVKTCLQRQSRSLNKGFPC